MKDAPIDEVLGWDGESIEQLVRMDLTPARLQCAELALVALRQGLAGHEMDNPVTE